MPQWVINLLNKPEVIGGFLAAVALSFWKGILPQISSWATKKFLKGDPGPQNPKELPAPVPEQTDASRLSEVAKAMTEWSMDEARRRVRELQDEVMDLARDKRKLEYQLEDTLRDNTRMSTASAATNIDNERLRSKLEQALIAARAADARAHRAAHELAEYKREVSSGFSGSASVTPLRPKAR